MKIVNFQGGLGNQMFIYAFSQYLKRQYPHERIYGSYWSKSLNQHSRFQLDTIFNLSLPPHHFITDCISKCARLCEITHITSDEETAHSIFHNGYWLDKKYWKDVDVRTLFRFRKPKLTKEAQNLLQEYTSAGAITCRKSIITSLESSVQRSITRLLSGKFSENSPMHVSLYSLTTWHGYKRI